VLLLLLHRMSDHQYSQAAGWYSQAVDSPAQKTSLQERGVDNALVVTKKMDAEEEERS
jgi:hypothetical protein